MGGGLAVTRLKLWLGAALGVCLAIVGAWVSGNREGRQSARMKALRADAKAHERITDADTGIGASDAERIVRLREFADKHGK